jgi:hypothetical protein
VFPVVKDSVRVGRYLLFLAAAVLGVALVYSLARGSLTGGVLSGVLIAMVLILLLAGPRDGGAARSSRVVLAQPVFLAAAVVGALVALRDDATTSTRLAGAMLVGVALAVDLVVVARLRR